MNAWQKLVSNSTLIIGTAWEHLFSQKTGTSNVFSGTIYSDGIDINIDNDQVLLELQETIMDVQIDTESIDVLIDETSIEVIVSTEL